MALFSRRWEDGEAGHVLGLVRLDPNLGHRVLGHLLRTCRERRAALGVDPEDVSAGLGKRLL